LVNQRALGLFFGVCAGAIWAVEAVLGKILFSSLTFIQVTASEVFFATPIAFAYVFVKRERVRISVKNMKKACVLGLVGTVFAPLLFFYGLTQTFTVNATLIAHLQPLFVAILGFYLLKERVRRHDLAAGVLIGLAVILVTSRAFENLISLKLGNLGDLVVLLATLSWAIVAIPGKQLTMEVSSGVIVGYRFLIASLIFLPPLLFLNQLSLNSIYQPLLGMIVGFGYIFYYEGLKRLKASQVALTELSSPFFAAALAWYFLGEGLTLIQVTGALLLMLGLFLLMHERNDSASFEGRKRENST